MNRVNVLLLAAVPLSLWSLLVEAHHSITANFDTSREIEIRGTVVDFNYVSPHANMVIEGIGYEGGVALNDAPVRWEIESSAVKGLAARGIKADTFKPGDAIRVVGAPHRNASLYRANSSNFSAIDGSQLALARPALAGEVVVPDAEGVMLLEGLWIPPFQREGTRSALPLNEAGLAAWSAYQQTLSPANTCEPMSLPVVMNAPSYMVAITFGDGEVAIFNEAYDVDRHVRLGDEFAPADPAGQWGDIRGRIAGDALVVESRNYPVSRWGLGAATQINGGGADVPSSEQKALVERFSTSADGLELYYEYVLTDPVYMSAPHYARIVLRRAPQDARLVPYDCNVASASQFSRAAGESVLTSE